MRNFFWLLLLLMFCPVLLKGEMSSTNYTIYADSFNLGGVYSTSTDFSLSDTAGEMVVGSSSSGTYEIRAGFQAMERGGLSLSIENNTLNLGTLDVAQVKSASTTITVGSDSASGYLLTIGSADPSPIAAVTDHAVSAGSEEYGMAISGIGANFSDDEAMTAGLILASSTVPVTSNPFIFTVKAARNNHTTYGAKNQNVVLSLSANF